VGMTVEVSLPQSLRETAVAWIFAENSTNGTDEGLTSADENGTTAEENGSAVEETEEEALRLSDTSGAGLYTDFNQSGAEQGTDSERTDSEALKEIGAYDAGREVQSSESFSFGLKESSDTFFLIWLAGRLSLGLYMLIGNIRLFYRLKKERRLIGRLKDGLAVYSVPGCYCLAGVIHPAIYVDMEQIRDEAILKSVLRHEREHYRTRDNLWQLIRGVCLILQWHNPLVWRAYFASKKDCELACDYRVVREMNDKKRYAYGQSLLAVCGSLNGFGISLTTAMGGSRKFMEERIVGVMKPKRKRTAVLSVVIVVLLVLIGAVSVQLNAEGSSETQESVMDESQDGEAAPLRVDIQIENYYITNIGNPDNLYYIDENHVLWGCGYNYYGQLGQGTWDEEYHTEFVKIAENVVHVDYSSLGGFVIYLTEDHELYGFGSAADGALLQTEEFSWEVFYGDKYNHREENTVSTPVLLMEDVAYACCGRGDVACMTEDGDVYIWGTIWSGEFYYGDYFFVSTPQKVLSDAVLVTGGAYNHAALLQDGTVWTWGYNYAGSCGVEISDDTLYISEPVCVAEDAVMVWTGSVSRNVNCLDTTEFESFPHGLENTVILKKDGTCWACGVNVGEETKTLSSYWEVVNYDKVCADEFIQLTGLTVCEIPNIRTYDDEETAPTEEIEELSPQKAWEIVGENFFARYGDAELEESGENLLAVLETETVYSDDGTALYSWKYATVYVGEKDERQYFVNYYIFIGNDGEEGWLLVDNFYYVDENNGLCGAILTV
ncbi:MAG: hypothetical protein LUG56_08640, partial [Lachnospiraceae bacterium]|nr:hypothetical protein [Lachnospiraceae bacterium]